MRRRRRQHSSEVTRIRIGSEADSDFPVEKQLTLYADRLLGSHEWSQEFLHLVLSRLSLDSRRRVIDEVYGHPGRKRRSAHHMERLDDLSDPDDLARDILRDVGSGRIAVTDRGLEECICRIWKDEKGAPIQAGTRAFEKRLAGLRSLFHLGEEEGEIVCLLYCYKQSGIFESLCDSYSLPDFLKFVSVATNLSLGQVSALLGRKGRLIQSGVVEPRPQCPCYRLEDEIVEYMAGISDVPLVEKYLRTDDRPVYDLSSFSLQKERVAIVRALLSCEGPASILLYGDAGTGKTEFSRSATASAGKEAVFVQQGDDGGVSGRRLALQVAANTVSPDKGVLIVDEADTLLNTQYVFWTSKPTVEKGWLNDFLDRSRAKIIWITNDTSGMEGSLLRRFSYSLRFKGFSKKERENTWLQLIGQHPLRRFLPKDQIRRLAAKYQVNAAGIASALDTVRAILPPGKVTGKSVRATLEELLARHQEATGREPGSRLDTVTDKYDISALNLDTDVSALMKSVHSFAASYRRTETAEGFNMNLLFWGKPGTGKTEYARYIAAKTGMDLVLKRASDLISCWVGGTEKNIKDAFDEARRDKAILFLDEADTFFINRESAYRSWEVSQTNELLTQMENHQGILICCTNLLANLDKAAMRRFHWKVEFKPLTREGKIRVYQRYFGASGHGLGTAQEERLEAITDLTPGDIKAVWQRLRFLPEKDRNHDEIISALEKEVVYRGDNDRKQIGFVCGG